MKDIEVMSSIAKSPVAKQVCREIVRNTLVKEAMDELRVYDEYTLGHSLRVAAYAVNLGITYFMDKKELIEIGLAGVLHDIGKISVDKKIIQKPAKLTVEEYRQVKQHVLFSCIWLGNRGVEPKIIRAVSEHHERRDGSGYPFGISGSELTLYGRILAVADIYDAVTVKRVYNQSAMSVEDACTMLSEGACVDKSVVDVFNGIV